MEREFRGRESSRVHVSDISSSTAECFCASDFSKEAKVQVSVLDEQGFQDWNWDGQKYGVELNLSR